MEDEGIGRRRIRRWRHVPGLPNPEGRSKASALAVVALAAAAGDKRRIMMHRPRRSVLYMPASNARAIEKARGLACDAVILDLEDAVAADAKAQAREQAVAAIAAGGFGGRELIIRCNGLDTPWGADDLAAAAKAGPDAILVPKVNGPGDIAAYDAAIDAAPKRTALWAMIETPASVFALNAIGQAAQTSRLACWVIGLNDLAKAMGGRQTPDRAPHAPILSLAVAAARANGLAVLDSVTNAIDDADLLEAHCRQATDIGFDGKTLIHPNQIETANRLFSPDAAEVAWARAVIAAFALPENARKGALQIEGRLAERLHLEQAERLVEIDAAIHERIPA
jgi:citrate lyase subunit beta/citryl-CoA lyase